MRIALPTGLALAATAFALAAAAADNDPGLTPRVKLDFSARGIAKLERIEQDPVQAACTAAYTGPLAPDRMQELEKMELATVRYPADGRYLGDWKRGERIAQDGSGNTWSDPPTKPAGGNCYNCHQISPQEMSYGTIGPSLLGYGKLRGTSEGIQRYTYAKIYDAKAFNLCSAMPRFGHVGALTEEQIRDLTALLLDPQSPVNQ